MTAHVRTLKPFACPKGMDPRTWRQTIEKELNALFDKATALITALDVMEADSEDLEDGADAEPWLGWGERGPQATMSFQDGRGSPHDDREEENEHGGDINDERQGDDEREADPAEYDQGGYIEGGLGL
ncbi:hypothetical protein EN780_14780 [Mesorhizobium sp. M4B.F.Ca.ET.089.01.1.1]|uniref:hypothetical protein n=1 Tax=Mesorhizobium sp. M4B.F.Ca.ET.089.01.1.1 TaxID=2496662 RepID=UPI000FE40809|nr:hypothetical protein [Mesorhizobium sp. M4B.F.Ca.ET.089.01.1.1]RWX66563.1 hypothetical protein EN780_14780 [Mesorhizobium sp. M4B.F.Ca.ET.089.01.1.1]